MIGERGVTLSSRQKQRIQIAQYLIKDHEIVVFDDCLSAVDAKTENEIISNLYNYLQSKTAVIDHSQNIFPIQVLIKLFY